MYVQAPLVGCEYLATSVSFCTSPILLLSFPLLVLCTLLLSFHFLHMRMEKMEGEDSPVLHVAGAVSTHICLSHKCDFLKIS